MTDKNLPSQILLVDSDRSLLNTLLEPFAKFNVEVFAANDLTTAMYRFDKQIFKVVLVEQHFPELDGISIIQRLRRHTIKEKATASFIMFTNNSGMSKEQNILLDELGQILTIGKPISWGPLLPLVQKAYKIALKRDLTNKMRNEISVEIKGKFDFALLNQKIDDLKDVLDDEYIPLKMDLYERSENHQEALNFIEAIEPDRIDSLRRLNMLGRLHLKLGRLEDAQKALEKADELAPRNLNRVTQMVDLYLRMRIPEQAIEKQKMIMDFNPDCPEIKFDLFKQLEQNGFSDEAASFCRDTSGPKEVVAYFNNKGVVLAQTEHAAEAITEYGRALNYFPKHKSMHAIHFNLALAILKTKDPKGIKKAIKHLEAALELSPEYAKAQQVLDKLRKLPHSA